MMLRSLDEKGGIGVYSDNLTKELLAIDTENQYVLFYRSPDNLGRFADRPNVTERWLRPSPKPLWDQIAVPLACRRERVDVVFNPKFTVPLLAPCKAVMVVHGADWFIPEQAQFYKKLDVGYIRVVMPWYFRKATVVLSVSQLTTDNFNRVLSLPPDKVRTVYFGPARHFRRIEDPEVLEEVRQRYSLPERFVLTLTKLHGSERKNLGGLLRGYAEYHRRAQRPASLVIGGKDCHLLKDRYGVPEDGYGRDIHFPGWMDQRDLPAVYSLADLFLYPSNLEAFPIPITEAMACGVPIVTSNLNGLEEIAGDAALLVDADDAAMMAEAMSRIVDDPALTAELSRRGLERARLFTWEQCASRTLEILENLRRR